MHSRHRHYNVLFGQCIKVIFGVSYNLRLHPPTVTKSILSSKNALAVYSVATPFNKFIKRGSMHRHCSEYIRAWDYNLILHLSFITNNTAQFKCTRSNTNVQAVRLVQPQHPFHTFNERRSSRHRHYNVLLYSAWRWYQESPTTSDCIHHR